MSQRKNANGRIFSNIRISVSSRLLVFFFSVSSGGYYFIGQASLVLVSAVFSI